MTAKERAYWSLKLRLLLSEVAEIKRMLEEDPAAKSETPVMKTLTQSIAGSTIPQ